MEISTSRIKVFKNCRREYYLRYVQELEPVVVSDSLSKGKMYHQCLEELYNNGSYEINIEEQPKVASMVKAYETYIYPKFKCSKAEQEFKYQIGDNTLFGYYDGIAEDGRLVEHKTTANDVDDKYIYDLQWDEQVLNYMLASGSREIYYTICKKPSIRQKQNETAKEYYERCLEWYKDDTEHKINLVMVSRTDADVDAQRKTLEIIFKEINDIHNQEDVETACYKNPQHCKQYGIDCPFKSICLNYVPEMEMIEFKHKESRYPNENNELDI